jgi:cytochrome c553
MKAGFDIRVLGLWSLCIAMSMLFPAHGRSQAVTVGDVTVEARDFAPDQTADKRIAKCLVCHGAQAGGDIDFGPDVHFGTPALRGIQESYLKQSLIDYKTGRRVHEEMNAIALLLDEETIDFMARTFTAFPVPPLKDDAGITRLAREDPHFRTGQTIAREGIPEEGVPACVACHGTSRQAENAPGPHLAGQNSLYVQRQLEAFASETRLTLHADLMEPVVQTLSPDEIEAVAHFYEQLIQLTKP